jgi:hypothetical protein
MIIDEPMEMDIKRSFKVSKSGDFFDAKSVVLTPPLPRMAKLLYKMEQYFSQIQKEAAVFASSLSSDKDMQEAREQQNTTSPITPVESIPQAYSDDSPKAKDVKIAEIEELIVTTKTMMTMSSSVDMYAMTNDFGRMITQNNLCTIKGVNDNQEDVETPLTMSLWDNQVDRKDRVAIMLRYCCFFDLTSSLSD